MSVEVRYKHLVPRHDSWRKGALRKICNPREEVLLRRRWGGRQEANLTSCAPREPSFRRIEFRRIEFGGYNGWKAC